MREHLGPPPPGAARPRLQRPRPERPRPERPRPERPRLQRPRPERPRLQRARPERRGRRAYGVRPAAGAGAGQGWQAARRGRGDGPAARPRRRPGRSAGLRRPHQGRRPGSRRAAWGHHLLTQGLHPADPAVPGPLRLLHVRHRAAPPRAPVPGTGPGAGDRPPGGRPRLQGSPVHPGGPAGGSLAPGAGVAGRARLRRHPVLRAGHGHPRARGDRPAPASEPGRAELAGLPAPEAGRPVHGHDARDDRQPPVHR